MNTLAEDRNVPDEPGLERPVCHLEWFINSRCDYTCKGCIPEAQRRPDLGLEACLEALASFLHFAAETRREARLTFYPRQAEFTDPFLTVLSTVRDRKKQGLVGLVACATRGDVPDHKVKLLAEAGVDVCRLTIDGPERVQDPLRRPGSFEDTIAAMRHARSCGIRVVPLMILMARNAPHVVETLRLVLAEGLEDFALQAAIRGDVGGPEARASLHPDPDSPFNDLLTAGEFRTVLLEALTFLDSAGPRHEAFRTRFVRANPMYARLFFELGRVEEYERLAGDRPGDDPVQFALKADGDVSSLPNLPALGSFPGASFAQMFAASHPMRWFDRAASLSEYRGRKQQAFAKCSACPVRGHCTPTLIGAQDRRLLYHPDVHCWVEDPGPGRAAATASLR